MKDIVTLFSEQYSETLETQMPLQDYLLGCRDNLVIYALVAEQLWGYDVRLTGLDQKTGAVCCETSTAATTN